MALATQPGQAWSIDFIDIQIVPGAPLSLYNPRGEDNENVDVRVSGVVRTGLREAMRGYFLGDRRARMFVTVHQFEGISTGATLLVGGEMEGEIEIEIRDPLTGETLARSGRLDFSRVVASGLLGFGAMIAGGGSQERKYADEISKVSRQWMNTLLCLDQTCSVARGVDEAPVEIATAPEPDPEPVVAKPEPELVVAEPVPEPQPVTIEPVAEPEPDPVVVAEVEETTPEPEAAPAEPEPIEELEIAAAPQAPEPEPEPEIAEPEIEAVTLPSVEAPEISEADPVVA
ncbi:MAG: DUF6778 family protein, partial [Pseudomonadota bacterium]